jgi:hypothetical protein
MLTFPLAWSQKKKVSPIAFPGLSFGDDYVFLVLANIAPRKETARKSEYSPLYIAFPHLRLGADLLNRRLLRQLFA